MRIRWGLRSAVLEDRPLPYAASEAVRAGYTDDKRIASRAIDQLERRGLIHHVPDATDASGRPMRSKCYLPGPWPIGPAPEGGWRLRPALDGVPGAVFEPGAVPVETQDVTAGVTVEPVVEAPDEPGVGDAVRRPPAERLGGPGATVGGADLVIGHGLKATPHGGLTCPDPLRCEHRNRFPSGPWTCEFNHPPPEDPEDAFVRRLIAEFDATEVTIREAGPMIEGSAR
jgi:hypothetical protein